MVSDSHLFHNTEDRERSLVALLEGERYDLLVLLGDMYDFWYEYGSVVPKYASLFTATVITLARRKEVHYVSGNHDAWVGDFWRRNGVKVHRYGFQRTINGIRYLFTHGDYIFGGRRSGLVRAVFHSRWANFLFSLIHPDLGILLASKLSKESRKREEEFDFKRIDRTVSEKGIDVLVSGHLHLPTVREIGGRFFACPGDWMEHFTYLKIVGRTLELRDREGRVRARVEVARP